MIWIGVEDDGVNKSWILDYNSHVLAFTASADHKTHLKPLIYIKNYSEGLPWNKKVVLLHADYYLAGQKSQPIRRLIVASVLLARV